MRSASPPLALGGVRASRFRAISLKFGPLFHGGASGFALMSSEAIESVAEREMVEKLD